MLAPGTRLESYEVLSLLGSGGMGEVYRAHDTKLGRAVAIKVVSEAFTGDPERVARLEREAQMLASLNHPHIATIHGLEHAGTTQFLVMELVEGESLAERLAHGPLPVAEALTIARQVADALEAAHDKGIIHRDLKPANIALTSDGHVKVLDFGLAKAFEPVGAGSVSMSPTLSLGVTQAGMILGTAAYMSPEQARGKPADRRSDVWAFGCVLYEMLTGHRSFDGEDVAVVLASVIKGEPDWSAVPPEVSRPIVALLRGCLEKDRRKRVADMGAVLFVIDHAPQLVERVVEHAASRAEQATPASRQSWSRVAATIVLSLVLGIIGTVGVMALLGSFARVESPQPARFVITLPPEQQIRPPGGDVNIAISADGRRVVFVASTSAEGPLILREIDQPDAVAIRGVAGRYPFFSPDGRWVGFFANGELKKVSVTGGAAITLTRITGGARGGTWGPNNTIVFATNAPGTGLMTVSASGGEPKPLTKPLQGERLHIDPAFLPGGRAVLFVITGASPEQSQVGVLDIGTGERKTLVRGGGNAAYVDSGHLIYAALGTLRAAPFDVDRLALLGDAIPVVEAVGTAGGGAAEFAVSRNGVLVYQPSGAEADAKRSLVWVDRRGQEQAIAAPRRSYVSARLSPDGTRVALDIRDEENDTWVWDLTRATMTRLTFEPTLDGAPVWTPDSNRIVFASDRSGIPNLFWRAADGTGSDERLTTSTNLQVPQAITTDGKTLVLREDLSGTGRDLRLLTLDPAKTDRKGETKNLLDSRFNEDGAAVSPDGKWIVYYSNDSGQNQVYVRPFPNVGNGRWQVSTDGGARPAWSPTGRELFYLAADNATLMAVPVSITPSFSAGTPTKLFTGPWYSGQTAHSYDVSRDGQRFLMIKEETAAATSAAPPPSRLVFVMNWAEELKRSVPVPK